jgi:hypothetical protein
MKSSMAFGLGLIGGSMVATTTLLLWQTRERSRLVAETSELKQDLLRANLETKEARNALHIAQQGLQSIRTRESGDPKLQGAVASSTIPAANPTNSGIMDYLGEPVPPPSTLDPKYSARELVTVFKTLCETHGVKVEKLGVDTTEFPFVIHGVLENGSDFFRNIAAELRALPGYSYGGSATGRPRDGSVYFSLNMTPSSAFPRERSEAIHRRLMLRLQMISAAWAPDTVP